MAVTLHKAPFVSLTRKRHKPAATRFIRAMAKRTKKDLATTFVHGRLDGEDSTPFNRRHF